MKIYKDKFKMDLQLFADEGTEETPPTDEKIEDKAEKTFTQDDLDEIIAKRLVREKAKFESEFKSKIEIERQEAEELAKLSEKERQKVIFDKQMEEFEQERASFKKEKIELEVTKQLAAKSLPIEFASLLVDDEAEQSFENIATFEKNWQLALERAVKERIAGKTPEVGGTKIETISSIKDLADGFNIIK